MLTFFENIYQIFMILNQTYQRLQSNFRKQGNLEEW